MPLISRDTCTVLFALTATSIVAASQGSPPAPGPQSTVTVIGCVQRQEKAEVRGVKSPSGFVLMNVSNSPFGGALPDDPETPAATAGGAQQAPSTDRQPRSGDPVPGPAGGAALSPGLTYLLDGKNVDQHAGERVEVRGTLHTTAAKLSLTKKSERGGAPNDLPQRLAVQSMRTLAKDCSR